MSYFRNVQLDGAWVAGGTYTFETQGGIDPPTGGAQIITDGGALFDNNNENTGGVIADTSVSGENLEDNWVRWTITLPADLPAGTYYLKAASYVYCTASFNSEWRVYHDLGGPYEYPTWSGTYSRYGVDESTAYGACAYQALEDSLAEYWALHQTWEWITCISAACPIWDFVENYSQDWEFLEITISEATPPTACDIAYSDSLAVCVADRTTVYTAADTAYNSACDSAATVAKDAYYAADIAYIYAYSAAHETYNAALGDADNIYHNSGVAYYTAYGNADDDYAITHDAVAYATALEAADAVYADAGTAKTATYNAADVVRISSCAVADDDYAAAYATIGEDYTVAVTAAGVVCAAAYTAADAVYDDAYAAVGAANVNCVTQAAIAASPPPEPVISLVSFPLRPIGFGGEDFEAEATCTGAYSAACAACATTRMNAYADADIVYTGAISDIITARDTAYNDANVIYVGAYATAAEDYNTSLTDADTIRIDAYDTANTVRTAAYTAADEAYKNG